MTESTRSTATPDTRIGPATAPTALGESSVPTSTYRSMLGATARLRPPSIAGSGLRRTTVVLRCASLNPSTPSSGARRLTDRDCNAATSGGQPSSSSIRNA